MTKIVITDELLDYIAIEYETIRFLCEYHNMEFSETFEDFFNMRVKTLQKVKVNFPRKKVFSWLKRKNAK